MGLIVICYLKNVPKDIANSSWTTSAKHLCKTQTPSTPHSKRAYASAVDMPRQQMLSKVINTADRNFFEFSIHSVTLSSALMQSAYYRRLEYRTRRTGWVVRTNGFTGRQRYCVLAETSTQSQPGQEETRIAVLPLATNIMIFCFFLTGPNPAFLVYPPWVHTTVHNGTLNPLVKDEAPKHANTLF